MKLIQQAFTKGYCEASAIDMIIVTSFLLAVVGIGIYISNHISK